MELQQCCIYLTVNSCFILLHFIWRFVITNLINIAPISSNLMSDTTPIQPTEDPVTLQLKQSMLSNFSVFDHENTKTVDVSEVRAIIASLELYPTQTELHDLITEMEEEEPTGYIRYDRFEPVSSSISSLCIE